MKTPQQSDDIPAIFMTETKFTVAKPLKIILRKSIDEGKVPDIFKMANITPIHKRGAKTKPENYSPISLTSHIVKVFERVLVKSILKHLVTNNLLTLYFPNRPFDNKFEKKSLFVYMTRIKLLVTV